MGAQRCPYGDECFVESSRDAARAADLVVTNHALLAINAMHGGTALPEHSAVIIDEAHELVSRVTGAASAELSPQMVERVARRALTYLEDEVALELLESAKTLRTALDGARSGTRRGPGLCIRRRLCRGTQRGPGRGERTDAVRTTRTPTGGRRPRPSRRSSTSPSGWQRSTNHDVVWVADRERFGREARVSPLSVAGLMRARVFGERTTVLTSATLKLGGDFTPIAASVGLKGDERLDLVHSSRGSRTERVSGE